MSCDDVPRGSREDGPRGTRRKDLTGTTLSAPQRSRGSHLKHSVGDVAVAGCRVRWIVETGETGGRHSYKSTLLRLRFATHARAEPGCGDTASVYDVHELKYYDTHPTG